MSARKSKYQRCRKCRELVLDAANCANCAAHNPLSATWRRDHGRDRAVRLTLDQIEGNSEEALGGVLFAVKDFRK